MIFDLRMDDFFHEARLLAKGFMIDIPAMMTFTRVVSGYTVPIALLIASLKARRATAAKTQKTKITVPDN